MTSEQLIIHFISGKYDFYGETISSDIDIFNKDLSKFSFLRFDNCSFKKISFYDINNLNKLIFHNCVFEDNVNLTRCDIDHIQFSSIKKLVRFSISYSRFKFIYLDSNEQPINGDISIMETAILELLHCSNLNIQTGQFSLNTRYKPSDESDRFKAVFDESKFDMINFSSCSFENNSSFKKIEIINTSFFINCIFKKVSFKESYLGNHSFFKDCLFTLEIFFIGCRSPINSITEFTNCCFKDSTHFNDSRINNLDIKHSTFEKKTSFDSIEVNTINLYQVTFSQGAFFDNLIIKKLDNCDRKSIRTIKQELQKAENRIDFNRFRSYELAAHYKELNWHWKSGFKDKFILWATKWSTDFGNSWRRALVFTLGFGFIFYSVFFIIEFFTYENYNYSLKDHYSGIFWNGYIRFLLVTDFYNPIIEDRTYIQNFWSWIPFILGKIVIAFGIYEMIQSFRKFKA